MEQNPRVDVEDISEALYDTLIRVYARRYLRNPAFTSISYVVNAIHLSYRIAGLDLRTRIFNKILAQSSQDAGDARAHENAKLLCHYHHHVIEEYEDMVEFQKYYASAVYAYVRGMVHGGLPLALQDIICTLLVERKSTTWLANQTTWLTHTVYRVRGETEIDGDIRHWASIMEAGLSTIDDEYNWDDGDLGEYGNPDGADEDMNEHSSLNEWEMASIDMDAGTLPDDQHDLHRAEAILDDFGL